MQPIGTVLPGILLGGSDRDIQKGDWITYSISGNGSHQLRADNVTHMIYITEDIQVLPRDDKFDLDLIVIYFAYPIAKRVDICIGT